MKVKYWLSQRFPLRQIIRKGPYYLDTYDLVYDVESDSDIAQLEAIITDELRSQGHVLVTVKSVNKNNDDEVEV